MTLGQAKMSSKKVSKMERIIVKRVGEDPVFEEIENALEPMQKVVGGYLQGVYLVDDANLMLYCNEEGKFSHLPANFFSSRLRDIIVGDVFLARHDNHGELVSVLDEDMEVFKQATVELF